MLLNGCVNIVYRLMLNQREPSGTMAEYYTLVLRNQRNKQWYVLSARNNNTGSLNGDDIERFWTRRYNDVTGWSPSCAPAIRTANLMRERNPDIRVGKFVGTLGDSQNTKIQLIPLEEEESAREAGIWKSGET